MRCLKYTEYIDNAGFLRTKEEKEVLLDIKNLYWVSITENEIIFRNSDFRVAITNTKKKLKYFINEEFGKED